MKAKYASRFLRLSLLALLALCAPAPSAHAQSAEGSFDLPVAARWATVELPAGHYTFTMRSPFSSYLIELHGKRLSALILDSGGYDSTNATQSELEIAGAGGSAAIHSLTLADAHLVLYFASPKRKPELMTRYSHAVQQAAVITPGR